MGDRGGPGEHADAPQIFLSYRNDLSGALAGRLHDALERDQPDSTFQDREDLGVGRGWSAQLDAVLDHEDLRCFVLVVAPGFWTYPGPPPTTGEPLLWRADDPVLREIEAARRRVQAQPETFRFLVVLQDRSSALPTVAEKSAPGIPEVTAAALEFIGSLHVDFHLHLDSTRGVAAVRDQIAKAAIDAGAAAFDHVRTFSDLDALDARDRRTLAKGCAQDLTAGIRRHRAAVLLALVEILGDDHAAAVAVVEPLGRDPRERFERTIAEALRDDRPDDAYWASMARVVTVLAMLGGKRPRRLDSLTATRQLVLERLGPAIDAFDRIAGGAARTGTPAHVAAGLSLAVALERAIVTDYFRSRSVLVTGSTRRDEALERRLDDLVGRTDAEAVLRRLQDEGHLERFPVPWPNPQPTPAYPADVEETR